MIARAAALLLPAALVAVLLAPAPAAFGAIPDWVRAAIPAQLPPPGDARAQVLLDDTLVTVTGPGELTTRHRRVVKIVTAAGREDTYAAVWFDPETKIRSLRGWSIAANGTEYVMKDRDAIETQVGDYELFNDTKMKILKLPGDLGSIVAYEYERSERPYLMQDTWHFQEDIPVLRARFQVVLPMGWTHDAKWLNYAASEPVSPGVWELQSIPAIADEPRRPAASSLSGRVGFNFLAPNAKPLTWSDIARWYGALSVQRAISSAEMRAKVKELTANAADPVRPLARFAQRDIRYVAVEIGIGGYQPHAADDVFAKRFGDCKDKATLLRTMLKELGTEGYSVLVHTTRGATDPSYPTMRAFNHVISAIPVSAEKAKGLHAVIDHPKLGKLLLFDPTSTLTPFGQLPEYLQASRGLLVTNDGGELIELPAHAPEASQLRRIAKLQLDPKGTLYGQVEEVRSGSMASTMRATLQSVGPADHARLIQSHLAGHLAASTAAEIKIEHLDEPESDLVIRYKFAAPFYAKQVADMLLVRPRVLGEKSESILDLAKRNYAYVTDGPSLQSDEIEITMPSHVKLDELPEQVDLKTPAVHYTSSSSFENGVLKYRRKYALQTFVVARESLPELNSVWKKIMGDERASAVFK